MIIGIDFDGTIVKDEYPEIGVDLPGALETLKALKRNGHKVFLYTMRAHPKEGRDVLQEAVDWLEDRGVTLDGVNRSPARFSPSIKQFAHLYLDDRQFNAPLRIWRSEEVYDWEQVARYFLEIGGITNQDYLKILIMIRKRN